MNGSLLILFFESGYRSWSTFRYMECSGVLGPVTLYGLNEGRRDLTWQNWSYYLITNQTTIVSDFNFMNRWKSPESAYKTSGTCSSCSYVGWYDEKSVSVIEVRLHKDGKCKLFFLFFR